MRRVQANTRLTPAARAGDARVILSKADAQLAALREAYFASQLQREQDLQRIAFAIPEDVSEAVSFRDALGRLDQLRDTRESTADQQAMQLGRWAVRTVDVVMVRALAVAAHEGLARRAAGDHPRVAD